MLRGLNVDNQSVGLMAKGKIKAANNSAESLVVNVLCLVAHGQKVVTSKISLGRMVHAGSIINVAAKTSVARATDRVVAIALAVAPEALRAVALVVAVAIAAWVQGHDMVEAKKPLNRNSNHLRCDHQASGKRSPSPS